MIYYTLIVFESDSAPPYNKVDRLLTKWRGIPQTNMNGRIQNALTRYYPSWTYANVYDKSEKEYQFRIYKEPEKIKKWKNLDQYTNF